MLWLDWKLALIALSAFPVIVYASRFYRRRAREVYRESRLILARLNARLQETIAGIATIQAFGQEGKMYDRFPGDQFQLPQRASAQRALQCSFFSDHRNFQRAVDWAGALVWRLVDRHRWSAGGCYRRVYPVPAAHVPTDPRSGGEVQYHASRDGFIRTHFHHSGYPATSFRIPPRR